MADLPGSGAAPDMDATDIQFGEAVVAITPTPEGIGTMRLVPGVLDVLSARVADTWQSECFSTFLRAYYRSSPNKLFSPLVKTGMANQIWGDGD